MPMVGKVKGGGKGSSVDSEVLKMDNQDNKQSVMRAYDLFKKRDIPGMVAMCADDVEWSYGEVENVPFAGIFHGRDGVTDYFSKMMQSVEVQSFQPETFVAEGDKVIVTGKVRATVRATGIAYEDNWVHIFTVKDGKFLGMEQRHDTAAIQAAFMPPLPSSAPSDVRAHH